MLKLTELTGREAKWTQPSTLKMQYELHDGDILAATLRFRSAFGTTADAVSADGSWTFNRVGFWQTKVVIRESGSETDIAAFKNNTWGGGGTLELPDGRKYPAKVNSWSTRYEWKTEKGESLIAYNKIGGFLHLSSRMEIFPAAEGVAETPWMAMLGWYLSVLMCMDYAAVAAATT